MPAVTKLHSMFNAALSWTAAQSLAQHCCVLLCTPSCLHVNKAREKFDAASEPSNQNKEVS